jgi:hypothetical protein
MKNCVWCGVPCGNAAACLACAPNQGATRPREFAPEFLPSPEYAAAIGFLRMRLILQGAQ